MDRVSMWKKSPILKQTFRHLKTHLQHLKTPHTPEFRVRLTSWLTLIYPSTLLQTFPFTPACPHLSFPSRPTPHPGLSLSASYMQTDRVNVIGGWLIAVFPSAWEHCICFACKSDIPLSIRLLFFPLHHPSINVSEILHGRSLIWTCFSPLFFFFNA